MQRFLKPVRFPAPGWERIDAQSPALYRDGMAWPSPKIPTGLGPLTERYDAVLCDIWGVVHNGVEAFADACAALKAFQDLGRPVVLISNSPRPSSGVIDQLRSLGVPDGAWSQVVTSGDVTRTLLAERGSSVAWAIGPDRDRPLYEGLDLRFGDPETADFISCTGPYNDEVETPSDYLQRLTVAADRGLEMICANPDRVVQRGDRLIFCGGALAELYAELGGAVTMAGKPFAPIYDAALQAAARLTGHPLAQDRVLAIGDGMPTDLRGANRQGLECLFIVGGIHSADAVGPTGGLDAEKIAAMLAGERVHAAFALATLIW